MFNDLMFNECDTFDVIYVCSRDTLNKKYIFCGIYNGYHFG